jgi:hypothetical protein
VRQAQQPPHLDLDVCPTQANTFALYVSAVSTPRRFGRACLLIRLYGIRLTSASAYMTVIYLRSLGYTVLVGLNPFTGGRERVRSFGRAKGTGIGSGEIQRAMPTIALSSTPVARPN